MRKKETPKIDYTKSTKKKLKRKIKELTARM
jgi:hypothetical protein